MSGPILAHAARLGYLKTDQDDAAELAVLPLYERPFDVAIGAEQLAHAKQHIAGLNQKIEELNYSLDLTNSAIAKRGSILDYVRESILRDLLQLVKEDAKRVEYQNLLLSVLDDEKLLEMHREMVALLNPDIIERQKKRIFELESRDSQLLRALSEKEKAILNVERERQKALEAAQRAKASRDEAQSHANNADEVVASAQAKVRLLQSEVDMLQADLTLTKNQVKNRDETIDDLNTQLGSMEDQMESKAQALEQSNKVISNGLKEMQQTLNELLKAQEQSIAAMKGGSFWQQCRRTMNQCMAKIRETARDFIAIEGLREVIMDHCKIITIEMEQCNKFVGQLSEAGDKKKSENEKLLQSMADTEAAMKALMEQQARIAKEAEKQGDVGDPVVLRDSTAELLPHFMNVRAAAQGMANAKIADLVCKSVDVAEQVLRGVVDSADSIINHGVVVGAETAKRMSITSGPGSPVTGNNGDFSTVTENKELTRLLEEMKTIQSQSDDLLKGSTLDEGWLMAHDGVKSQLQDIALAARDPVSLNDFSALVKAMECEVKSSETLVQHQVNAQAVAHGAAAEVDGLTKELEEKMTLIDELRAAADEEALDKERMKEEAAEEAAAIAHQEEFMGQLADRVERVVLDQQQSYRSWETTPDGYRGAKTRVQGQLNDIRGWLTTGPLKIQRPLRALVDAAVLEAEDAAHWQRSFSMDSARWFKMLAAPELPQPPRGTPNTPQTPASPGSKKNKAKKPGKDTKEGSYVPQSDASPEFCSALRLKVAELGREDAEVPPLQQLVAPPPPKRDAELMTDAMIGDQNTISPVTSPKPSRRGSQVGALDATSLEASQRSARGRPTSASSFKGSPTSGRRGSRRPMSPGSPSRRGSLARSPSSPTDDGVLSIPPALAMRSVVETEDAECQTLGPYEGSPAPGSVPPALQFVPTHAFADSASRGTTPAAIGSTPVPPGSLQSRLSIGSMSGTSQGGDIADEALSLGDEMNHSVTTTGPSDASRSPQMATVKKTFAHIAVGPEDDQIDDSTAGLFGGKARTHRNKATATQPWDDMMKTLFKKVLPGLVHRGNSVSAGRTAPQLAEPNSRYLSRGDAMGRKQGNATMAIKSYGGGDVSPRTDMDAGRRLIAGEDGVYHMAEGSPVDAEDLRASGFGVSSTAETVAEAAPMQYDYQEELHNQGETLLEAALGGGSLEMFLSRFDSEGANLASLRPPQVSSIDLSIDNRSAENVMPLQGGLKGSHSKYTVEALQALAATDPAAVRAKAQEQQRQHRRISGISPLRSWTPALAAEHEHSKHSQTAPGPDGSALVEPPRPRSSLSVTNTSQIAVKSPTTADAPVLPNATTREFDADAAGLPRGPSRPMPLEILDGAPIDPSLIPRSAHPHPQQQRTNIINVAAPDGNVPFSRLPSPEPRPEHHVRPESAPPTTMARRGTRSPSVSKHAQSRPSSGAPSRRKPRADRNREMGTIHAHIQKKIDATFGMGETTPATELLQQTTMRSEVVHSLQRPNNKGAHDKRGKHGETSPLRAGRAQRPSTASSIPSGRPTIRELARNIVGKDSVIEQAISVVAEAGVQHTPSAGRSGSGTRPISAPPGLSPGPRVTGPAGGSAAASRIMSVGRDAGNRSSSGGADTPTASFRVTKAELDALGIVHVPQEIARAAGL